MGNRTLVIRPVTQFDSLFLSRRAHAVVVNAPSRSRNARFSFAEEAKGDRGIKKATRVFSLFVRRPLGRRLFFFRSSSINSSLSHKPTRPPLYNITSSWTNKLITAKDHAAVQINVGHLNSEGIYTGSTTTLALAGNVRAWGAADTAVDLLWKVRRGEMTRNMMFVIR